jgi:hypothetical protein
MTLIPEGQPFSVIGVVWPVAVMMGVDQAGDLGDVSAVAGHCVAVDGRALGPGGKGADGVADLGAHGEPDGVVDVDPQCPQRAQVRQQLFGRAGSVARDQDRVLNLTASGIWASAASMTVMWWAAMLLPALPEHRIAARI